MKECAILVSRPGLMQFSRLNFPQSSDQSGAEGDAAQERAHPKSLEDFNQPVLEQAPWQAAFRLAPNVRFTRTPESVLHRKPLGTEPSGPSAVTETGGEAEAVSSEMFINAAEHDSEAVAEQAIVPVEEIAGLQRLAATMRRTAAEEQTMIISYREAIPAMAAPTESRRDIAISDFAFWDAMPFELEGPAAVEPVAVPAQPDMRPVTARPGQPVTNLYREVPRKGAARAVVVAPSPRPELIKVPDPVVPVQVAPKPVVESSAPTLAEPPRSAPLITVAAVPQPEPQRPRAVRPAVAEYEFPPISLLQEPQGERGQAFQPDALQQSAGLLESVLEDFGIRGEIIDVRPGPVVSHLEFEPAPGG